MTEPIQNDSSTDIRSRLISQITNPDFSKENGRYIRDLVDSIFHKEILTYMTNVEAYLPTSDVSMDLPELDDETQLLMYRSLSKKLGEMNDENRPIGFDAVSITDPRTAIHLHSNMKDFRWGEWTATNIEISGINVPLDIHSHGKDFSIDAQQELLTDAQYIELTQILDSLLKVKGVDPFSRVAQVLGDRNMERQKQSFPLAFIANNPQVLGQIFSKEKMWVNPQSRLATDEEIERWSSMVRKIMGKEIVVSEKGYHSYEKYKGRSILGVHYPILEVVPINSEGRELGISVTEIPVKLSHQLKSLKTGWLLCKIVNEASGSRSVDFIHPSRDLYNFNRVEEKT